MKLHLDTHLFSQAMREYKAATDKDETVIINRAAMNVAFRAAQFTPMATAARIRSDLMRDPHLRYALTSNILKKAGTGVLQSPNFARAVEKMIARRVASRGFLRSGWAPAVEALGGSFRGRKVGSGHGWASKATISRLVAEIANTVPGIDPVGVGALQGAINFVAEDMIEYSQRILAQRAQQYGY